MGLLVVHSDDDTRTRIVVCKRCSFVNAAKPRYLLKEEGRLFTIGAPATRIDKARYPFFEVGEEARVTGAFLGKGGVYAPVWKSWQHRKNKDVYFAAKAFPEIKLSIHASGENRLAFTKPFYATGLLKAPNSARQIAKFTRPRASEAFLIRIMRVEVTSGCRYRRYWESQIRNFRKKQVCIVSKPLNANGMFPVFVIEAHYTSNPLGVYKETRNFDGLYVSSYQVAEQEFIHFFANWANELTAFSKMYPREVTKLTQDRRSVATLRVGQFGSNVFLMRVEAK